MKSGWVRAVGVGTAKASECGENAENSVLAQGLAATQAEKRETAA
jgi:hypothetical protein